MNTRKLIELALEEDIGPGDRTTETCIPADRNGVAQIRAKQDLVVCGLELASKVFDGVSERYGGCVTVTPLVADGDRVNVGEIVAEVEGPLRNLLIGERLTLNLMMKLSGIATNVREWVDSAGPDGPRIVDTRKTTPLLRELEKYAVRCGGGHNHRMALYDGIMVKDNHIQGAGSIANAVAAVKEANHHLLKVEVEVSDTAELREAIQAGAEVIMLDNMDNETLKECVEITRGLRSGVVLEASGNMSPTRIRQIADIGLDVISAGGLIHQATWVDLSMKLKK